MVIRYNESIEIKCSIYTQLTLFFFFLNSWKLLRFLIFILTREEKMQAVQNYLQ